MLIFIVFPLNSPITAYLVFRWGEKDKKREEEASKKPLSENLGFKICWGLISKSHQPFMYAQLVISKVLFHHFTQNFSFKKKKKKSYFPLSAIQSCSTYSAVLNIRNFILCQGMCLSKSRATNMENICIEYLSFPKSPSKLETAKTTVCSL